jgi:riboflavin transporter FmnP|tara:strand:+ start:476 stop:766 length:291 start_codon:yes stop_codon:yes gene_type:complete
MIIAGLLSALGLLFLIFKFGIRRIITFDIPIDITVTAFLIYAFAGTYSGMLAAMVGGLIVSITLFVMKRTMRREELKFVRTSTFPYRAWRWIGVQP